MTTPAWVITILGFIATITGSLLALATYISPLFRLKFYLNKDKNWKKVYIGRVEHNWQYKKHPEFIIEETYDENREWTTTESWMKNYPDSSKKITIVRVKVNGNILLIEDFISLDGGRYFVPVPKRKPIDGGEFEYWYTPIQINLSRIVGYYYRMKTIEEFMADHGLAVIEKDE